MAYATTFGIGYEFGFDGNDAIVVPAVHVTGEISALLQQNGIDPSTVNKLNIPSGYEYVGTMSVLAYMPNDVDWVDNERSIFAFAGPIQWPLSYNYRVHRLFPMRYGEGDPENISTLSVITFDDFRYNLNYTGSGTTSPKMPGNSYKSDWRVTPPEDWDGPLDDMDESFGPMPFEVGDFEATALHLYYGIEPALTDPWNAVGYNADFSKATLADKVLSSCGFVAVPLPLLRAGVPTPDWESLPAGVGEEHYMSAEYLGLGWKSGSEMFEFYSKFYANGNLQFAHGVPDSESGTLGIHDVMDYGGDFVPFPPVTAQEGWITGKYDGLMGIPENLDIQFSAKDMVSGEIIMYRFVGMEHGRPSGPQFPSAGYTPTKTLTDHIKTQAIIEDEDAQEEIARDGVTVILVKKDSDWDKVPGISEDRVRLLFERALELSRTFYARYFSCVGNWTIQGFHPLKPWAGRMNLEYGISGGAPYTRVWGDVDDKRMGFGKTDMSDSTLMAIGGVIQSSRPDGLTDLVLPDAGSKGMYSVEVMMVHYVDGGCFAVYDIRVLSNGRILQGQNSYKQIPFICYDASWVGAVGMLATGKTFNFDDNGTWDDSLLFLPEYTHVRGCG